jgi:glycosyltransferase involved in cell wall biosynthesis
MTSVSVCIPTFNYGRYIGRAVESVLAQTTRDFELLVVDNASTDETPDVLARFRDPRLRVHRNESNIGLFGNFRRCLELTSGELVKFLAADDWLLSAP